MLSTTSTIPDIRSSPDEWFKHFDQSNGNDNDNKLSKSDMLQALVETINAVTGTIPEIEQLMESFDTMWNISKSSNNNDSTNEEKNDDTEIITLGAFKKEGGLWELIVASGLLPPISPIVATSSSSGSYNDNMQAGGSGVGSGYNYDYEPPRSMRVVW